MKHTDNLALTWSDEAESDVTHILEYVAKRNPLAAHKLLDTIDEKVSGLPLNPKLYRPGRIEGTREMPVTPTYLVIYKESAGEIRILRVLHTAQMWPE